MADGSTKPIEEVGVGDEVLATDPTTGETSPQLVTATIVGDGVKQLVDVTIVTEDGSTDTITATAEHPFWVADLNAWVNAEDLEPGHRFETADHRDAAVTAVDTYSAPRQVHNLTVDRLHTYYVLAGRSSALVHNSECGPELSIDEGQFGKKWGKHAQDYGLNPGDSSSRQWFRNKITEVRGSCDEVRQGDWNPFIGGGSDYFFYRRGSDLLVTKSSGQFVTMFPMSKPNRWFEQAEDYRGWSAND
ncbi:MULTISPECIES: polymorphic toxin-type HINT domain-containing protein [Actinoalloteichus]|uniref:Pretoxin HINT domain n=1 Tax=Actinoalloteichus fjordicus TaxID=1612552 RepID=A0AAC9LAC1_9PSEU|nr:MULTISPECIES: polymorphic toxin-type HINT domain-containing protein [Actinoalloteichus]APU13260.1 Pretoxin HINT domain [Actinoalloteichus fjordicus]APU19211.1 Pretoxin HINT domain [Actinoalloteichus sp. GBA129-24]